ncbi:MAG: hypothetical protein JSV31_18080 [Desulfobacterales bacterium]|nr:MAG: hypothetical protein JSV31_18080 [Desulfobacterales bacterium]
MQRVFAKIFVTIIFGLSLLETCFLITNKFEIGSGYAHINDMNFSQANFKKLELKTPSSQLALLNNADGNSYKKRVIKIFGTEESASQNLGLEEIEGRINSFFSYLDQKQYVKSSKIFDGAKQQFKQIFEILIANSPIVTRETDSINDVLKNVFYFYRVLGKERITLIKDILEKESDTIEALMHTFYLWFSAKNENSKPVSPRPSLEQLYVYACFFLETLGGRNYLFRRDSKVRILTSYYCVLIIDQANIDGVNSNGIDIRPHIKLVLEEITQQIGLNYKNQYIMELEKLTKKYKLS